MNKFVFLKGVIFLVLLIGFSGRLFSQCPINPEIDITQFCDSLEVQNISAINSGDIDSIQWYFGEGDTIRIIAPPFNSIITNTYSSYGTYNLFMRVFGSAGCDTSLVEPIKIAKPNASFQVVKGCINDTTFYTDFSQPNADSLVAWVWDFGDGSFSFDQNTFHIYNASNNYPIELKITNNYGCLDSLTKTKLIESPEAGFIADTVCKGMATQFTDTSQVISTLVNQWEWDFGDGNTSTSQNPTHTFTTSGIHSVKLKVTNTAGCADSVFHDVLVGSAPKASFTLGIGCPFDTTYFYDQSTPNASSIISWEWDFGDGSPHGFAEDTIHVYTTLGLMNVKLTVINNLGCIDDTTRVIPMEKPFAGFLADSVCLGNPNTFTDTSTFNSVFPVTSWFWEFGDGNTSTNSNNTSHQYDNAGLYDVKMTVANIIGCADSAFQTVLVDTLPVADFSYEIPCEGLQTCFYDESLSNADTLEAWVWNFGDGSISFLQNPCHIFSDTGTYIISLIVTNTDGCESLPKFDTIYVSTAPNANFDYNDACLQDTTYFLNLTDTMGYSVSNWFWTFGDPGSGVNNNSSLENPYHLFLTPDQFAVKLVATNVYGCSDSLVKIVAVDSIPEAAFQFADTVAVGSEVLITDNSVPHGSLIISRFWDFGDGNTALNPNPVIHTYDNPGEYTICLTAEDINGCSNTFCDTIVISDYPFANFNFASDTSFNTSFFDLSTPGANVVDWFWDFGDPTVTSDTISGVQNPTYTYPEEGFYTACLWITDKFGGTDDTCISVYSGNAVIASFTEKGHCLGDTTWFFDHSYSPISSGFENWFWDFGDGNQMTYTEPIDTIPHYYSGPGTYHVKLGLSATVNGIFMTDTMRTFIQIYEPPIAKIDTAGLGVCFGTEINFTDLSIGAPADTIKGWTWDFGNGDTAYIQNPIKNYADTGTYKVKLFINTVSGCHDIDSVNAYVNFAPSFSFLVENNCVNSPTKFIPDYDSTKLTIVSWNWNFGDITDPLNTSNLASPTHVYDRINLYTIKMRMSAQGCPGESERTVLIYPIPFSQFSLKADYNGIQGKTAFENESIYAQSYLWDFGNGNTSSVPNPIEVYEKDSTYLISLTSYNEYGCSDTSWQELLVFFKGLYFPTAFSPNNPNDAISRFEPKGINLKEYLVQVFDMRGNLMWEGSELDENGSPTESWDGYYEGRLMPQGMYVWQASGIFLDGTAWTGQSFENNIAPKTNGVVTLIK